jgi:Thoeris protein ThsB, TIR-like domain
MFVSFSSTDIERYQMMCAWKADEQIDFNFGDFQRNEANSENENYIKRTCSEKIQQADTFVLLIGNDTFTKTTFVKWEVDVAIEKGCRLIGVNSNNCRFKDRWLCPYFFADKGAVFVPFSSRIVTEAMKPHRFDLLPGQTKDFRFYDHIYTALGYQLVGDTAVLPTPSNTITSL